MNFITLKTTTEYLFYLFVFLFPVQTRWIFHRGELNNGYWEYGSFSLYITDIVFFILLVLFGVQFFISHRKISEIQERRVQRISPALLFLSLFELWVFISIFVSSSWQLGLYTYIRVVQGIIFIILISRLHLDFVKLRIAFILAAIFQSLLALYQFFVQKVFASKWLGIALHVPYELGQFVVETNLGRYLRSYGTFGHPNILSGFLAVSLLFTLSLYYHPIKNRILRVLLFGSTLLELLGMFVTFSKSGWLGLAVGAVIFIAFTVLFEKKEKRMLSVPSAYLYIIVVFIIILGVVFKEPFLARFSGAGRLELRSTFERIMQYRQAIKLLSVHPFVGVGVGGYTLAYYTELDNSLAAYEYQPVHNVYLLVASELGIIGLALFLWIILYPWIVFFKEKHLNFQLAVIVSISITCCIAFIFFFDHYFWSLQSGRWLLFLSLGVSYKWTVSYILS